MKITRVEAEGGDGKGGRGQLGRREVPGAAPSAAEHKVHWHHETGRQH